MNRNIELLKAFIMKVLYSKLNVVIWSSKRTQQIAEKYINCLDFVKSSGGKLKVTLILNKVHF